MHSLNREVKSYLKFDASDMAQQMNNAFEGKKENKLVIHESEADIAAKKKQ